MTDTIEPVELENDENKQIARSMVAQARASGVDLVGPDGLLAGLTKRVLELALEEELTDHLGLSTRTTRPATTGELSQRDPDQDGDHRDRPGADRGAA